MRNMLHSTCLAACGVMLALCAPAAQPRGAANAASPQRVDYLSFAQGAIPVSAGGAGALRGASFEHAIRMTDGDPTGFVFVNGAAPDTDTEFIYELPATTNFDRFEVPNVLETPSV